MHMPGKFDGILLCSDLDDTLLTSDKRISPQNIEALNYFMSNGGKFTFATGRVPRGARLMLNYIIPNAPMICFNGAALYDFADEKFIWQSKLDAGAKSVLEYVEKEFPDVGIEVCTDNKIYFCRVNYRIEEHKRLERFPDNYLDYHQIPESWCKVIFMVEEHEVEIIKNIIAKSPFKDQYSFVRSSPWYYELLPHGTDKGAGLVKLAQYLNIPQENTFAMGDNENDITLIQQAGTGIAVFNAIPQIKAMADMITVDNNSHAAKAVIEYIENNLKNRS